MGFAIVLGRKSWLQVILMDGEGRDVVEVFNVVKQSSPAIYKFP